MRAASRRPTSTRCCTCRAASAATIERHRPRHPSSGVSPLAGRAYRYFLPIFPAAIEQFDLEGYDLVVSASHCAAKSAITSGRDATPLLLLHADALRVGSVRRLLRRRAGRLAERADAAGAARAWPGGTPRTAHRPHRYLAISQYVADRIRRYYNRRSAVVHPPVDTTVFAPADETVGDHLLVVSALVPYKRIELAIEACRLAGVR